MIFPIILNYTFLMLIIIFVYLLNEKYMKFNFLNQVILFNFYDL